MKRRTTELPKYRTTGKTCLSGICVFLFFGIAPLRAQSHLIVVTGLAGTPRHAALFEQQATALVTAARTRLGLRDERIIRLGDNTQPPATADGITRTLQSLAERARPNDVVALVLIGHGSALSGAPRFNVRGPDLTAEQLAGALARFTTQELVIVNASSSSGPWIQALAGPRRTVITATRSATERDETTFAGYFAAAFGSDDGDADKDGRVSVLEAFEFARQGVARHYQDLRRLRTENALLDDDGDGRGSLAAGPEGDGRRAVVLFLDAPPAAEGDSETRALFARRDSLQRALAELQSRRATMDSTAFAGALERVLLDIARTGSDIRARQAGRQP